MLPSFNDDIQGTAAVAVATVLAAVNITGIPLHEQKFVVFGFGSAGRGISELLCQALVNAGLTKAEAHARFWAVDKDGLLVQGDRTVRPEQRGFARLPKDVASWGNGRPISLHEVVDQIQPTVLMGVSGQRGVFTEDLVRAMAAGTPRPVILPLSNPTACCEASPGDLLRWTGGCAIVGTGSPFPAVEMAGRMVRIAQTNNSYIFPGLALGILSSRAKLVSEGMMMAAAEALARLSPTRTDPTGAFLPPLENLRKVSMSVAVAVGRQAAIEGLAQRKGEVFIAALRANVWEPVYLPYKRRR